MNKKPIKPKNGLIIDKDGNKRWYKDGLLHREDGPAREMADGDKYDKYWYFHGKLHREDGPAVEYADGRKYWCLNGVQHRVDGPAVEHADGSKYWCLNGRLHREDGPAVERNDGTKQWYQNSLRHRIDGPAIERANGSKEWYINNVKVTEQIVMQPETITLQQISKEKNVEVRSIMIERYGWLRYIQDSEAKIIDARDNDIENTKEALFFVGELGNRLVVTCPTGRVFTLRVPNQTNTCEAAQKWLGNESNKINVIGRT